jgi:hypothetical protein
MSFSYNLVFFEFAFTERFKLICVLAFNKLCSHSTIILLNNRNKYHGVRIPFATLIMSSEPHSVLTYPVVRASIEPSLYIAAVSWSQVSPINPAQ